LEGSNLVHALGGLTDRADLSALIRVPPFVRRASMTWRTSLTWALGPGAALPGGPTSTAAAREPPGQGVRRRPVCRLLTDLLTAHRRPRRSGAGGSRSIGETHEAPGAAGRQRSFRSPGRSARCPPLAGRWKRGQGREPWCSASFSDRERDYVSLVLALMVLAVGLSGRGWRILGRFSAQASGSMAAIGRPTDSCSATRGSNAAPSW
jgi:hypothetical protein